VETVARLAGALKLAPGRTCRSKALLVDALPAELPTPILRRAKMGFVFPWERWLRNELRKYVASLLTDGRTLSALGLDPAAVHQLWTEFLASRPGVTSSDILALMNLLHWARRQGINDESRMKTVEKMTKSQ
jgi:asparagine synthase (glutamine-hydrolysing)